METTTPRPQERAILDDLIRMLHRDSPLDEIAAAAVRADALDATADERARLAATTRMIVEVRKRLDDHQQRERGLLSVIESAQDLAGRLDLTGVLNAIVSRARTLVGSDIGWLSIFDETRDEFRVVVADGAFAQRTRTMWTRRDRGVAGIVMSTRLPFATTDYLADPHFAHDPELDETFRAEGIVSLVGVPLIHDGDIVGLLFVADRFHRTHGAQSVAILCALATHGALALRNARDFERANAALEKADRIRGELERHVRSIQEATDAHERLTSLLARGASLSTLCQTVAQLLGGRVVVLDEANRVVARAAGEKNEDEGNDDLSLEGDDGRAIATALRASRRSGRSVVAFDRGEETCRLMSVIGGADVLGAVALFHRGELSEIAVRTFERSSSIVGIVLLSQERVEAAKSGSVTALVHALLSMRTEDSPQLADRAARHGLDLDAPLSLTLVDIDGPGAAFVARRFRLLPAFAQQLVDEIDGHLIVIGAASRAAELHRLLTTVVHADLGAAFRGVQSRPLVAATQVAAVFARFRRALPILQRIGVRGRILGEHEIAIYTTLFETHDQAGLDDFLHAAIGTLLAHDAKRGTQLAATLLAFFDGQQNARVVADRVGVHVNTVRQRLATIESLIGPWDDASRALELHVALRLWGLRDPSRVP